MIQQGVAAPERRIDIQYFTINGIIVAHYTADE
jgi:hypothetical protein